MRRIAVVALMSETVDASRRETPSLHTIPGFAPAETLRRSLAAVERGQPPHPLGDRDLRPPARRVTERARVEPVGEGELVDEEARCRRLVPGSGASPHA